VLLEDEKKEESEPQALVSFLKALLTMACVKLVTCAVSCRNSCTFIFLFTFRLCPTEIRKELGTSGVLLLQSYTGILQRQADHGADICQFGYKVSRLYSLTHMGTGFVLLGYKGKYYLSRERWLVTLLHASPLVIHG